MKKDVHQGNGDGGVIVSPAFHSLVVGDEGDVQPSSEQMLATVSILLDAGICCCFAQEFALIYYGTRRLPNFSISFCVRIVDSKSPAGSHTLHPRRTK